MQNTALEFKHSILLGPSKRYLSLPELLLGDQVRLKQILINLVKNAIKFTYHGNICVSAGFDLEEEILAVEVRDDGAGIATEDQQKLFEAFAKLKRTEGVNEEGTGMGLHICNNILKQLHGCIWFHSDGVDKGTTFTFTMPMRNPPPERNDGSLDSQ